jgi:energy-coupling factor transporter ATP-binding protein EcfA2
MWYKKFAFKNFKGIEEMVLPLSGAVTTLIGLNESGKTTILEAIFCFSYGSEDLEVINPGLASLRNPEQWIPISQRANFNETITLTATVGVHEADKVAFRKYMRSAHGLTLSGTPNEIEIAEKYVFENSRHVDTKRTWTLAISGTKGQQRNPRPYGASTTEWQGAVQHLKDSLPRIWYFPNFLFELPERFTLSELDASDDEEKDRNAFYRSTFEQILENLGYGATLNTHVVARLGSVERADQRSLSAVLLDMGRTITTTIFEGWDRILGRAPAAQEVELSAGRDGVGAAFLELKIKGPDGYYDLSERSLGFRWFFMFLLMTSFRGDVGSSQKPLFLLDEPASNLHSSAQAELLKSFENLVESCHLMYTTHSHHLINLRWLDSAYVVKNSAMGSLDFADYVTTRMGSRTSISATKYRQFVVEHPNQTSYFQPVLDLLDYRPSSLEPIPNAVLVEGKSDFYLLRYVAEILGHEWNLHTVPGTGAGSLDTVIRLHIGWGKSFLVLLDGDAEGKKQLDRYTTLFGSVIEGRCLLLPDVCQDAKVLEAEDLLTGADRKLFLDAVFKPGVQRPGPKKALLQAVIELYARREAVPLSRSTVTRFEQLGRRLEAALGVDSGDR